MAVEPFDAADSRALRDELGADLMARYAGDSEPGVKPSAWDAEIQGFGDYAGNPASRCFERRLGP